MKYEFLLPALKRKAKPIFALSLMAMALTVVIVACQKTADTSLTINNQSAFNAAYVKEWYYGTFKKSAEWASSNTKGKKLPDWNHPTYGKIGNFEAIEYPLVKEISAFPIAGGATTSPDNMRKIANASQSKIVFIKTNNNKVQVREIDYIPDWEYLQKKGFDISDVSMVKDKNDFNGRISVKKWDGSTMPCMQLSGGKITRKGNIKSKTATTINNQSKEVVSGSSSEICNTIQTCTWSQTCYYAISGDYIGTIGCSEWEFAGDCTTEEFCYIEDAGGDPCALYGLNCDGSGGGDEDEDCSVTVQANLEALANSATISNQTLEISTLVETPETRTKKYNWVILKGIGWYLFSFEKGVHVKTDNPNPYLRWVWQSLEHKQLSKVGIVIGGDLEYNLIDATPTIGLYNAIMDIDFGVKYSVVCRGSPVSFERTYNGNKNFNVND
jgi:hypothetical protein